MTFVTIGELARWAEKRHWGTRARTELVDWLGRRVVLPYDERVAWKWGQLSVLAEQRGRARPINDTWIAACCLVADLPLATLNLKDFKDFAEHDGKAPRPALFALRSQRSERVLDDGGQWRISPDQVGKLVDNHGHGVVAAEREQGVRYLAPIAEVQRGRCVQVRGEIRSGPAQRFAIGRFLRREVETARGLAERAEQERLALTSASGDHPQDGSRLGASHDYSYHNCGYQRATVSRIFPAVARPVR